MPPEDEKRRLTWEWLAKAREDILTADRAAQPPPLVDSVLFHCQQAAEKALKAYLTWNDQPFRRVHDLEELIRQGAAVNADMAALLEA
ncbi:MAG: HEPN domain-containing protein, partial [Chloroflexota bacterium]